MARPALPSQATARRYVKAALDAGLTVTELRVEPDGTFRVIAASAADKPLSDLERWKASREAR